MRRHDADARVARTADRPARSRVSCDAYRAVVRGEPRFVPYFRKATPELLPRATQRGAHQASGKLSGGVGGSVRAIGRFARVADAPQPVRVYGLSATNPAAAALRPRDAGARAARPRRPSTARPRDIARSWFKPVIDLIAMPSCPSREEPGTTRPRWRARDAFFFRRLVGFKRGDPRRLARTERAVLPKSERGRCEQPDLLEAARLRQCHAIAATCSTCTHQPTGSGRRTRRPRRAGTAELHAVTTRRLAGPGRACRSAVLQRHRCRDVRNSG